MEVRVTHENDFPAFSRGRRTTQRVPAPCGALRWRRAPRLIAVRPRNGDSASNTCRQCSFFTIRQPAALGILRVQDARATSADQRGILAQLIVAVLIVAAQGADPSAQRV